MKYVKKLPKTDKELSHQLLSNGWVKIKEPKSLTLAVILSFPLTFPLIAPVLWLAYLLKPELFSFIASDTLKFTFSLDWRFLLFVLSIFAYMFFHEMLHMVFVPNFAKSEKTVWGLNSMFGFVFSSEPMTKERFLVVSSMPFLLLSIVALLIFYVLRLLNGYTFILCLINAAGSCVDFLNIFIVGFGVKKRHTIICNGFDTFYNS